MGAGVTIDGGFCLGDYCVGGYCRTAWGLQSLGAAVALLMEILGVPP